jgi:hypothetical protein
MIKNVVILVPVIFTERHTKTLGVPILSKYFNVIILDVTAWYKPVIWHKRKQEQHQSVNYHSISNMAELIDILNGIDNPVIFDYLYLNSNTIKIRQYLKQKKCVRTLITAGHIPQPHKKKLLYRLLDLVTWDFHKKILLKISNLRENKKKILSSNILPDMVVFLNENGQTIELLQIKHIVKAHYRDYDEYLTLKDDYKEKEPYAVYLDQALLHHPDFEYAGEKILVSEDTFYKPLNKFFDFFEKASGQKVVYAAHPMSKYDQHPSLLAGRTSIQGQTAELIRDCSIVFCHYSTAISFAALWNKPIVFLTTKEINRSIGGPMLSSCASFFSKLPINLQTVRNISKDEIEKWFLPNKKACEDYVRLYIKCPGSSDQNSWEIISLYIRDNL